MNIRSIKLLPIVFLLLFAACKSSENISKEQQERSIDLSTVQQYQEESQTILRDKEVAISNYRHSRTRYFDLLHTSLDLSFDYDKEVVFGSATLKMKPYFYDQQQIVLDAKDFDLHSIKLLGEDEKELNFRYNGEQITVYLPKYYSRKDTLLVSVKYTAKPNENRKVGSAAITDTKGLYFINASGKENKPIQIWTQGETEHNSKWFPTFDSPNERGTQDIRLTVQEKYRTISNGKLLLSNTNPNGTRTDHWEMDLPHAPYLAAVVVGEFVEIQDSWEDIPVNYYVEEKYAAGAKVVFQNTPEMIGFFSDLLGVKFPWQKYDQVVVRDFVSGAMENTTLSVFMEELNLNEREAIDSEWDGIIAHELFHQWFGNYVTTESWANLTLNEAFANYSEYLWYEYKEGVDEADLHHISEMEQYFDESQEKQVDLIRFFYEDSEDMFDSHSYAKGGRILHMLRRHLGDDAFFKSLNYYLNKHAFSSVEVHDLRLAFEEISGQDLNWFFNQWFLASGHPILDYEVDYSVENDLLLTVSQKQNLANTPLYKLPFKVSWYSSGERYEKEFLLAEGRQQFAIGNKEAVDVLYFDERLELLADKRSTRGKDHFLKQFKTSKFGVARYEALDSLSNNFAEDPDVQEIVALALKDSFAPIREMAMISISRNPDWIMQIKDLEKTLLSLAENDPKNTVKAGAIELLSALDPDKYAKLFLRLMNDSSYYVSGAALSGYLENEENIDRMAVAERFLAEDNIRIAVAIADYFITEDNFDQATWFHQKIENIAGQSLYYFLGYYGDYFAKANISEQSLIAVEKLYQIGLNHQANYIRAAAFQSLFGFIDDPGVLDKIKDLYEKEVDEMAKRYKAYYLQPYLEEN